MKKIVEYILLASIPGMMFFILPVPGMEFAFAWQLAALWISGLVFALLLRNWWYRLFFILALIRTATLPPVMESYIELLFIALFLAAAKRLETMDMNMILNAIAIAAIGLLGWMALQKLGILTAYFGPNSTGPFNPDLGGIFLALCLPAFFRARWLWGILPIVAGIMVSGTTTGMASAAAAVGTYIIGTYRSWKVVSSILFVLIIFGTFWFWKIDPLADTIQSIRWPAWRKAIIAANVSPAGRGLGSWNDTFPLIASGDARLGQVEKKGDGLVINNAMTEAHNEYINALFELGYPCLILIACFLVSIIFRAFWLGGALSILPACGLTALLVGCFGFSVMHYVPPALVGCAWLGMFEGRVQSSKFKMQNANLKDKTYEHTV